MLQSLMNFWQADKVVILTAALAVSEALALIPALKSNSILQLFINGVKALLPKA